MPCTPFQHEGMRGFMCHRGPARKPKACHYCGQPSTVLCDHPKGKGTCDTPMCNACSIEIDLDLHQCQDHCQPGLF